MKEHQNLIITIFSPRIIATVAHSNTTQQKHKPTFRLKNPKASVTRAQTFAGKK